MCAETLPTSPKPSDSNNQTSRRYKVAEICCGCGGASLGFEMSGYEVVLGADISKHALRVFGRNHPSAATVLGDITKPEVKAEIINHLRKTGCDVLFAGVCCQPFSNANPKRGREVGGNPLAWLYRDAIEIARDVRPDVFVFENVKRVTTCTMDGVVAIDRVQEELKDAGYRSAWRILNTATFGVPQKRERLILVATRHDVPIRFPTPTHSEDGRNGLPKWITAGDAAGDIVDIPDDPAWEHEPPVPNPGTVEEWGSLKPGQNFRYNGRKKLDPSRPFPTVTTKTTMLWHWSRPRQITVRERLRAMSFPDDFNLSGTSRCGAAKMIGNSVPPKFAAAVARSVRKMLDDIHGRLGTQEVVSARREVRP